MVGRSAAPEIVDPLAEADLEEAVLTAPHELRKANNLACAVEESNRNEI